MNGRLVSRSDLRPHDRDAMLSLLDRHFLGMSPDAFEKDLDQKNWVILLEDPDGSLRGFSTLHLYDVVYNGEEHSVVYSGDTIVDPSGGYSSSTITGFGSVSISVFGDYTLDAIWHVTYLKCHSESTNGGRGI